MIDVDVIIAINRPLKERAGEDVWQEAMKRPGGAPAEADPVDPYVEKVKRLKTVEQYAAKGVWGLMGPFLPLMQGAETRDCPISAF